MRFDSRKEAGRYADLKLLEQAGEISELQTQVRFNMVVNGTKICAYVADFVYLRSGGRRVVEDVKSDFTRKNPVYRIKKKMMAAIHGIDIVEV